MRPGAMITAGIGGVIAVIIALVTYPILQAAADTLYLEYVPHCKVGNESFTRVYPESGIAGKGNYTAPITVTETMCAAEPGAITMTSLTATAPIYSEHGEKVGAAGSTAGAKLTAGSASWKMPYAVLEQYSGISTLVLSILPILSVTGFLGMSASNIYKYTRGDAGSIQEIVTQTIGTLLVVIVGLYLAPTIFEFLQEAFAVSEGNRYSIMGRFNTIIMLVFSFVPVVFCAGLLVMFGHQGLQAYKTMTGNAHGGSMM